MTTKKRWIATLSIFCLGAGVVPNATSKEIASLDWEEITVVDAPKVRVRISADRSGVLVEGENLKMQGRWLNLSLPISYHIVGKKAVWSSGRETIAELPLSTPLSISGNRVLVDQISAPQKLKLLTRTDGKFDVVADMSLEKYVEGVVAGEMPSNWPLETLKAQAVAARSFLLALRRTQKYKNFDVDSSQYDQVFRTVEALPKSDREVLHRAITESQGLILKSGNVYPVPAYFHSDCGGVTEKASAVWGKTDPRKGAGPSCPLSPGHQWTLQVAKAKLARIFGLRGLSKLIPESRSDSGRVLVLRAETLAGSTRSLRASKLRKFLGYNEFKSTMFAMVDKGNFIEFRGRGFGHGVGLCQWGSRLMGENGKSFLEILAHYYPQAQVVPVSRGMQLTQSTFQTDNRRNTKRR